MIIEKVTETSIFKSIVFYSAFFIARIPLWAILIACLFNEVITTPQCLFGILAVIICRSYTEAELAGGGVITFAFMQGFRMLIKFLVIIFIYLALLFILYIAEPMDNLLISVFLLFFVILFFNVSEVKKSMFSLYFSGYSHSLVYGLGIFLLWFYLCFVPDSFIGSISILVGIYILEFMNLFKNYNLPEYAL